MVWTTSAGGPNCCCWRCLRMIFEETESRRNQGPHRPASGARSSAAGLKQVNIRLLSMRTDARIVAAVLSFSA